MTELLGVDVAWTKPSPQAVKNAGYAFILGYLSTDPTKNLTGAYITECHTAGLGVGLVWETTATRAGQGAVAGSDDGRQASAQAAALGAPPATCLFWAVDFAASPEQVVGYGSAFRAAVRPYRSGPYGSDSVIGGIRAAGVADVCWQTCAWSDGRVNPAAALYQRGQHTLPTIAGIPAGDYDEDVQLLPDAGLWLPTPPPDPTPEEDDMPAILMRAKGDGRWYHVDTTAGTKEYVPTPAVANEEAFLGMKTNNGAAFVEDPAYMAALEDITPGGSPKPQPVSE